MIFEGKIELRAPGPRVWDFLLDIDKFTSCMPGLENVTTIDDRSFDGVIGATVGPISGKFNFRSTIVESTPPKELKVRIEGTDSVTGSKIGATVTATLNQTFEGQTELSYRADVDIKGRIAILGDMIMRATSSLLLDEFTRRLRIRLEGDETAV